MPPASASPKPGAGPCLEQHASPPTHHWTTRCSGTFHQTPQSSPRPQDSPQLPKQDWERLPPGRRRAVSRGGQGDHRPGVPHGLPALGLAAGTGVGQGWGQGATAPGLRASESPRAQLCSNREDPVNPEHPRAWAGRAEEGRRPDDLQSLPGCLSKTQMPGAEKEAAGAPAAPRATEAAALTCHIPTGPGTCPQVPGAQPSPQLTENKGDTGSHVDILSRASGHWPGCSGYRPGPCTQVHQAISGDSFAVTAGVGGLASSGQGQGCCCVSCHAQDGPTTEDGPPGVVYPRSGSLGG